MDVIPGRRFFMRNLEDILEALSVRAEESAAPLLVAVDGRCGAGKSTLAEALAGHFGAPVFHVDDFYLPFAHRTASRMDQPGGHIYWERLAEEVLAPASHGETLSYRPYHAHSDSWGAERIIPPQKLYIVEGAYALLPQLDEFYRYKIFVTHDTSVQLSRLLKREGKEKLQAFIEKWIPAEEFYFTSCDVRARADAAFDTSEDW